MNVIAMGMVAASAAGLSAAMVLHSTPVPQVLNTTPRVHTVRFEPTETPAVPEIAGYRTWAKVNTTPQYIMSSLDLLCRMPTQAEIDAEKQNPHVRHYMLCYVNSVGEQAMLFDKKPKFPVGSIIVKEKLDSSDPASKRTLITAMIKHEAGYDPPHGNWEYIVTNGDASVLQGRGKLANCGGCHAQKKNADYVFRDEMGADRLARLK